MQDVSHENYEEQRTHVEHTLRSLLSNTKNSESLLNNIINVGNKCDLIDATKIAHHEQNNLPLISSTTLVGIEELLDDVERKILVATNRSKITIRVPMGGSESSWLYKNSAVTGSRADPKNSQNILLSVVISEASLQQFRHHFLKRA